VTYTLGEFAEVPVDLLDKDAAEFMKDATIASLELDSVDLVEIAMLPRDHGVEIDAVRSVASTFGAIYGEHTDAQVVA
jgi:hypothetical protein